MSSFSQPMQPILQLNNNFSRLANDSSTSLYRKDLIGDTIRWSTYGVYTSLLALQEECMMVDFNFTLTY
jgi:hypothetical protein